MARAHRRIKPDRNVLRVLRIQARDALNTGFPLLHRHKLDFFRKAIRMKYFYEVVASVKAKWYCDLFSTLQEVEYMERMRDEQGNVEEIIVQCCLILQFWEHDRRNRDVFPDLNGPSCIFYFCTSFEEIAHLHSRLSEIVVQRSRVRRAMNYSLVYLISTCFNLLITDPKWRDLLLVFKEARLVHCYALLRHLQAVLEKSADKIPQAAATLFLSYVSDAIYVNMTIRPDVRKYFPKMEENIVSRLLKLGASPVVSRELHPELISRLREHVQPERWYWWSEEELIVFLEDHRRPTALNRLLCHGWSPELNMMLSEYTCCSLDAAPAFRSNFDVIRMPSLRCLAAQKLRESDLDELSGDLRFFSSRHMTIVLPLDHEIVEPP